MEDSSKNRSRLYVVTGLCALLKPQSLGGYIFPRGQVADPLNWKTEIFTDSRRETNSACSTTSHALGRILRHATVRIPRFLRVGTVELPVCLSGSFCAH